MKYPSLISIGEYITENEYQQQRVEIGQWVQYKDTVETILRGNYYSLMPLHFEVSSTYQCNFECQWCNCSQSRMKNKQLSMSPTQLKYVVRQIAKCNAGIQWTGGEPLMNPYMIDAIKYAQSLGVRQCLFTNGSMLTDDITRELFTSNLTFVRVSMNCLSPSVHKNFHGLGNETLSIHTIENIRRAALIHNKTTTNVMFGISFVINSINICDMQLCLDFVRNILTDYPNAINYIVIRPVSDEFTGVINKINDSFSSQYNAVLHSTVIEDIINMGCRVKLIGKKIEAVTNRAVDHIFGKSCLGGNLFSEISPDGSVLFCSERYGNQNYVIGNIFESSLEEIWLSSKRRQVYEEYCNCGNTTNCPSYSRGAYFNHVARQVEVFRQSGELDIVIEWLDSIRNLISDSRHSFFI